MPPDLKTSKTELLNGSVSNAAESGWTSNSSLNALLSATDNVVLPFSSHSSPAPTNTTTLARLGVGEAGLASDEDSGAAAEASLTTAAAYTVTPIPTAIPAAAAPISTATAAAAAPVSTASPASTYAPLSSMSPLQTAPQNINKDELPDGILSQPEQQESSEMYNPHGPAGQTRTRERSGRRTRKGSETGVAGFSTHQVPSHHSTMGDHGSMGQGGDVGDHGPMGQGGDVGDHGSKGSVEQHGRAALHSLSTLTSTNKPKPSVKSTKPTVT